MVFRQQIVFIFLTLCSALSIHGQTCNIKDSTEFDKVEIKVKRPSKLTEEYNVIGEALIPVARPIKKVKDLSDLEKEQIKKLAANDNVCVIFIYYDKSFRKDKIYCFWGRDK